MVLSRGQGHSGPVFSCSVPLSGAAGPVGALTLSRRGRAVLSSELQALAAAAAELVLGLENARLFADARRGVEELRLLLDVGRAITASLDLEPILEASAGLLTRMVDASNTFILILDPAARELRGVAASNPANQASFRDVRIGLDERSIAAKAARTGKAVTVLHAASSPDVRQDWWRSTARRASWRSRCWCAARPSAWWWSTTPVREHAWTDAEIERATLVARQIAVAVANARLFDDLQRSYDELAHAQEELVKRERLAALGELSAVVAHEVRNPLGVIFNSLGSLRRILHADRRRGDAAGDRGRGGRPPQPHRRRPARLRPAARAGAAAGVARRPVTDVLEAATAGARQPPAR